MVFTKHKRNFVFHPPLVESVRHAIGDARSTSPGKVPENVWPITAVVGNARQRTPFEDMPPQLPLELPLRIVLGHSEPGDCVLDPYSGNGTTAIAAVLLSGRRAIGIERCPLYVDQSQLLIRSTIADGLPPRLQKIARGET